MKRRIHAGNSRILSVLTALAVSIAFLLALPACGSVEKEQMDLPRNLYIQLPPETEVPFKAVQYKVSLWFGDAAQIEEDLMHAPVVKTELSPTGGQSFLAENGEGIYFGYSDASPAPDGNPTTFGYFQPYHEKTRITDSYAYFTYGAGPYLSNSPSFAPYNSKLSYGQDDLSFFPMKEAQQTIVDFLASWGVPVVPWEAYSVDLQGLREHRQIQLDYFSDTNKSLKKEIEKLGDFTAEDEAYYLFFRQVVDELTVLDANWRPLDKRLGPQSGAQVKWSSRGIEDFEGGCFFQVEEAEEEYSLLSREQALEELLEPYVGLERLNRETTILSAELCYVPIYEAEDRLLLMPAWVFIAETWVSFPGQPIAQYDYLAVHAGTGELLHLRELE